MAADGMVLTNHDHQTRVGILTGKAAFWDRAEAIPVASRAPVWR